MAKAKDTRCGRFSHEWDCGLCVKCLEEHPAAKRSRIWNAMMARIVAAGADAYGTIPQIPDYSTREAVQARALEMATPWYRDFMAITRQDGRTYRAFRRAVERTGATLALPFPSSGAIAVTGPAPIATTTTQAPRRARRQAVAA